MSGMGLITLSPRCVTRGAVKGREEQDLHGELRSTGQPLGACQKRQMRARIFLLLLLTLGLSAQPNLDQLLQVPLPREQENLQQIRDYVRAHPDALTALVKRPKTRGKVPLLVYALESADPDLLQVLLEEGADPNTQFGRGQRPALHAALLVECDDQTRERLRNLLLHHKVDLKRTDSLKRGAFHVLVESRGWEKEPSRQQAANELSQAGAPLETEDVRGFTPLLSAVMRHDAKMVRILLNLGADRKRKSQGLGLDALTLAEQQSHTLDHPVEAKEVVETLTKP